MLNNAARRRVYGRAVKKTRAYFSFVKYIMADDLRAPVVLITVPSEVEAVLIVNALRDYDITGRAVGGYTSGFKIGAPSEVAILVEAAQLEKAQRALAEIEEKRERGRTEREADGADSGENLAPRKRAAARPGYIILGFAVIGALVGLLLSLCEAFASAYLLGFIRGGPSVIPFFLIQDLRGRIPGLLVGAFAGSVIGLISSRPGREPQPGRVAAGADRQRLIWICVIALILGGIGCWDSASMLRRHLEKTEPKTALMLAARAEFRAVAGPWWPLPRIQLGLDIPASAGMIVGGMLVLFRRRSGRLLLLASLIAATAACMIDLTYMAATSRAYADIEVRYGEQVFHDIQRRHQKRSGKQPHEPPALKAALYMDDASHRSREALLAFFKIVFCLTSIAYLRHPVVRAMFPREVPMTSRQC